MPLNWVLVGWSMAASASLTLAMIHFLVWLKSRTDWANLLFSVLALAAVATACCELWMMRAATPAEFGMALRYLQLALWVAFLSMTGFVLLHLRAGRPWLAWTICALRSFSLLVNFRVGQNLNYQKITALRHVRFLGESVAVADGTVNPWMIVGQVSAVLLAVFVTDAAISVWRRGERRLALMTGGSIVFCVLGASVQGFAALWDIVPWPFMPSVFFIVTVVAMSYEMSHHVLRAVQLGAHLQSSEAALRQSEWRLEQKARAAGIGTWEWNASSNQLWVSDGGRALIGFATGRRIDFNDVLHAVHPEDRGAVREAFVRALEAGRNYEQECRVLLPGGGIRWIATRGRIDTGTDGKPATVRGVSIDVTERLKAAKEIAQQRHQLEHLSRVSTLNELSGSIGHELNQPLQAILSNAQAARLLLANENPNLDEIRETVDDIVRDNKRAGEIIWGLRALLKKGDIRFESLDLNSVLRDVLRIVASELLNAGVAVTVTPAPELPPVKGDRVQLQQVLLNLILNGCEAMTGLVQKERELVVTTQSIDDGRFVLVCITDQGPGIPPQDLERVFDAFYTTKAQGLGVGLSVCRGIIAAHGGRLWAANNQGSGARFCFSLPAQ